MSDSTQTGDKRAGSTGAWEYHHTGMIVRDLQADVGRYERLFGYIRDFEVHGMTTQFQEMVGIPGISCDLVQLVNPACGNRIELIEVHDLPADAATDLPVYPGIAHTAYLVPDLTQASQAVAREGGIMLDRVVTFAEGDAAYFRLPGGSFIELEELT